MRIIGLGDVHGSPYWKEVVAKEPDVDKIVIIGDYFDNYNREPANEQIRNFEEIIEFKENNPDKVILLIGNHDMHYHKDFMEKKERYSGYQHGSAQEISEIFHKHFDKLQMCYKYDNLMFSHAGITKTWLHDVGIDELSADVEKEVNQLIQKSPLAFAFEGWDPYGDDVTQSPIWVRPKSLIKDATSFRHVVGHTTVSLIDTELSPKIVLIDALRNVKQYLIYDNEELSVGKI